MKATYSVNLPEHLINCEANYQRLCQLMPNRHQQSHWNYITGVVLASESYLSIEITERARYTTSLLVIYKTPLARPVAHYQYSKDQCSAMSLLWLASKNTECRLKVQMYHDASLAEVVEMQQYRRFQSRYRYPNPQMHQADEQTRINAHLAEMLGHCLKNGRIAEDILAKMRLSLI